MLSSFLFSVSSRWATFLNDRFFIYFVPCSILFIILYGHSGFFRSIFFALGGAFAPPNGLLFYHNAQPAAQTAQQFIGNRAALFRKCFRMNHLIAILPNQRHNIPAAYAINASCID